MNKKSRIQFLNELILNLSDLSEVELSVAIEYFNISIEEIPLFLLANRNLALAFSIKDVSNFEKLNHFHDDEEFVNKLIYHNPVAYKYASNRIKNIQYIVESICFNSPKYFILIPEKFRTDEELVLLTFENKIVEKDDISWLSVLEPVCSNKNIVKKILENNRGIYKYLNDNLKNDDEIIKIVLKDYYKFKDLPEEKKEHIEYMNLACVESGIPIKNFTIRSLNDPDLMSVFLKRFPGAIFWCGDNIKNDEKIAIEICSKKIIPSPYMFFSEEVRSNENIAECAILADFSSGEYLPSKLTSSKMLAKSLIKNQKFNSNCIQWFDKSVTNCVELMQLAIEKDIFTLKYLGDNLKNDELFIQQFLKVTETNMFSQISKWKEIFSLLSYKEEDIKTFSIFLEKIQEFLSDKTYAEKNSAFKSLLKELGESPLKQKLIEGDSIANYYSIMLKENLDSALSNKKDKVKIKI